MSSKKRSYAGVSTAALVKAARKYEGQRQMPLTRRPGAAMKRLVAMSKETGYLDTALTGYALDTTGTITLLNAVPQGVAVTQRVGKKILLKSLQYRGISINGTTATLNDCAWIIVYDKRPTGALPSITDILVSVSSFSMNNDNNSGRFSIVKREDFVLLGNQTAAANQTDLMARSEDGFMSLKNLETVYKAAATGGIADIEQGALYLVTVGNNAGTAAANAFLSFRLRFLDA